MRVGLAGCGGIARQYHLRALRADPRVELVAVADPSAAARAALADVAGIELLDDFRRLVSADGIDAVVVCAASAAHADIAEAVAGTDKHLYLEKPVALELARAIELRRALAARPEVTTVGFNYRLNPAFAKLRGMLREGAIGDVRVARCWHCEAARPESMPAWKRSRATGGGVMLDLVSHSVDTARWLLGDEIEAVDGASIASRVSEQDDARVRLRTRTGVAVELVSSYVQGRKHRWELEGAGGVLRADRWPRRVSSRRRPSPGGPSRAATSLLALPIPRREPSFALAVGRFVDAALGARSDLPTIDDGVRSLEVVLDAERAAGAAAIDPA